MTILEPLLVRASAGTGKTYQLTGRMLSILVAGGDPASILATTFTRKAAGEILDRILVALARAAENEQDLIGLRAQVQAPGLTSPQCRLLLHRLLRDIHRVRVCTLDSLFSQLARSFAFELRLPPGWRLSDEIEEVWLRRAAIDATLAAIEPERLATLVSMLGKGDALRSIDRELQTIILDGFNDSRWATPNAWTTLKPPRGPEPDAITQSALALQNASIGHASANKQLQGIGTDLEARIFDALAEKAIVAAAARHRDSDPPLEYYRKPIPADLISALRVAHDAAKARVLGLLSQQTEATGQILAHYADHIEQLKQSLRVLAFDDVTHLLATWVESLDFEVLRTRLDTAINHVLLDEFQDTSPAQWAVLRPLARRASEINEEGSFFCVGDTKQAIYGWRGGRAAIFDVVATEIPHIKQASQDLSYRGSPVISNFTNAVFKHLHRHPSLGQFDQDLRAKEDFEARAVVEFSNRFPTHVSAKTQLPGCVRVMTGPKLEIKGAGASAAIRLARLTAVADMVAQLATEQPDKSIGILTRTNSAVAELIFLLKERDVDVSQEGGNPLTDSALVELILSALMLSEHPGDLRWAYHVSHSPLETVLGLAPLSSEQDTEGRKRDIAAASDRLRQRIEHKGLSPTLLWLAGSLIEISSAADAVRLRQLVSLAHVYELNPRPRLADFVELVRAKRVERPRPAQVRVMTIHQSKGLEFDRVVLPEMSGALTRLGRKIVSKSDSPIAPPNGLLRYLGSGQWDYLPDSWRRAFGETAEAQMTEAICLLYVAITRARQELHIVIDPANKSDFNVKTAASLIFHALGLEADPTVGNQLLYESTT